MEFPFLSIRICSRAINKLFSSRTLLLILLTFFCFSGTAQVSVNVNQTAAKLVENLVGSGVTTLNPELSCPTLANGIFKVTNSNLGIKGGIILSTGYAANAVGSASQLADFSNSSRGDEDLTKLSGQATYDACKLEFDFIPTGETVKFKYVFGSEEYPSFACTQYNDVFAFFISGPGYPAHKNIALIPGTNIPVAINSTAGIVGTSGGKIGICEAMGVGSPFKEYYVDNSTGATITYNGFTKVFTAVAAVTPCATYHLKLAIADAKDHQYDSGVFIEEGSLSSNTISVSLKDNLQIPVPYCVRGCKNGSFIFKRKYSSTLPLTIHYVIGGTAINGKDYKKITDSVTIPAYDTIVTKTIEPISLAATGPKTIKLYIYSPFRCGSSKAFADSTELAIYDSIYTSIHTHDTLICTGRSLQINTIGDDLLNYNWSPSSGLSNAHSKNPIVSPSSSNDYVLTSSFLSCPPIHNHLSINLPNGNIVLKSNEPCSGATLNLSSNGFTGATYYWKGPNNFSSTLQSPSIPNVSQHDSGTYILSVSYPGCSLKGSVHVNINTSPIIKLQAKNDTVCTSSDATFSISAIGKDLVYQWQVNSGSGFTDLANGGKYSGVNSSILKISGVTLSMNEYTYQCMVSSTCMPSITSNPASLFVNELPVINSQSGSKVVCNGASTVFSVSANGSNLKYQWQISNGGEFSNIRNSSVYTASNTNALAINNVTASMSRYLFRCLVSGACSPAVISKTDTLIVNESPLINKQPANVTICTGMDAKFSTNAVGVNLNYQWQVNAGQGFENIKDEGAYEGANTNKLLISHATEAMSAYRYQCTISGACGSGVVSSVATLTVNDKPTITKAPVSSSICIGGHTSFSVAAKGGVLSYKWFVNSGSGFIPLTNGTLYNGVTSSTLTVTRANTTMSGFQYRCDISGNCEPAIVTSPVTLTIDSLPFISLQPANKTICAGNNVSFSVNADGTDLRYQWQVNEGGGSVFNTLSDSGYYSGTHTNTLNISGAEGLMSGNQYKCIVTSVCSHPITSHFATLTVNIPPNITKQPSNTTFCLGGNASISLSANGTGISYRWQVDTGAGFTDISNKGSYIGAATNNLSIKSVTALMSGYKYRCILSNACSATAISNTVTLTINSWPSIKAKGTTLYVGDYKSYQWYLNNAPVKGATTSTFNVTENGAYSVFVTDDNGCIDISPQYIINNVGNDKVSTPIEDIKIYPNPATSFVHFDAPQKVNVSISNSRGKVVMHKDNAKVMDISKLPNGVYIIQVFDESKKLLKTDKLLKSDS